MFVEVVVVGVGGYRVVGLLVPMGEMYSTEWATMTRIATARVVTRLPIASNARSQRAIPSISFNPVPSLAFLCINLAPRRGSSHIEIFASDPNNSPTASTHARHSCDATSQTTFAQILTTTHYSITATTTTSIHQPTTTSSPTLSLIYNSIATSNERRQLLIPRRG